MRMLELSEEEYPLVMQALTHSRDYIKPGSDLNKQLKEAISILEKKINKKNVPLGGSFSGYQLSKTEIQKSLFKMFRVENRIGR